MARIGIYLNDELKTRLDNVQEGINVSQVCQDAIQRAVEIEELKLQKGNQSSLIERLRIEKKQLREYWVKRGYERAGEHLERIGYLDLITAVSMTSPTRKTEPGDCVRPSWETIRFIPEVVRKYSTGLHAPEAGLDREATALGAWQRLYDFYFSIKDELDAPTGNNEILDT